MSNYDVIVIGAGILGSASAFYLSKKGAKVLVVDRAEPNQGASGRNAGSLHFQLESRLIEALASNSGSLGTLVTTSLQAIEDWRGLEADLDADLGVAMHGGLMVAETAEDIKLLKTKNRFETQHGLHTSFIGGDELKSVAPYLSANILAASYVAQEGSANPRLVTPTYVRKAQGNGVHFLTRTWVNTLRHGNKQWQIELVSSLAGDEEKRTVSGDVVLIAAGAGSVPILRYMGSEVPLEPLALQMNVSERVKPSIQHLVQHVSKKLSLKQTSEGNILMGGGWPAKLRRQGSLSASPETVIVPENICANLRVAKNVVPEVGNIHLLRTWTGLACVTPDHLPLLGPVPEVKNCFVVGGDLTFTLGPTLARMVSQLICNESTDLPVGMYNPDRFSS